MEISHPHTHSRQSPSTYVEVGLRAAAPAHGADALVPRILVPIRDGENVAVDADGKACLIFLGVGGFGVLSFWNGSMGLIDGVDTWVGAHMHHMHKSKIEKSTHRGPAPCGCRTPTR